MNWVTSGYIWKVGMTEFADEFYIEWREKDDSEVWNLSHWVNGGAIY